jgi:hypothetical protein
MEFICLPKSEGCTTLMLDMPKLSPFGFMKEKTKLGGGIWKRQKVMKVFPYG